MYNVDGYAAVANVTGGGVLAETASNYVKVATPAQFLAALNNIKSSNSNPYKVIEITADLDLGYLEAGGSATEATYSFFTANASPLMHPTLKTTGVSQITIQSYDGLTIYSKNGATIRHAEFSIKNGKNLIIRNLKFDELWEWDEKDKGNYDTNDWDYITIGDTSSASGRVWIDHCTFYKSYDGIVDVKKGAGTSGAGQAANGVTISWSEILPGSGNPNFMQAQFDYLETARPTMYNYLRGFMTQAQIMAVANTIKKGHLIGATSLKEPDGYTVTLHHNYYKDLQDRMPRLRSGDVQVFNLYADESNARQVKKMYDALLASTSSSLTSKLTDSGPTYHFGITSNGSISTEGGAVEVTNSFYKGVLTPLRNNQTDPSNSSYTGAIRAFGTRHELLYGDDAAYMPNPQSTYSDGNGVTWMVWQGNSGDSGSSLGPSEATPIAFAWHNGTPPTPKVLHQATELPALLGNYAGAGKVTLTGAQWMNANN